MSTILRTNMLAIDSHRKIKSSGVNSEKASARLSSGMKINSGADDAAGLVISETMRSQIRGLDMADRNVQDGISLFQLADGALQTISDMVIRVRELSIQAGNDTNTDDDRQKLDDEFNQILEEIDTITDVSEYNGIKVLKPPKNRDDIELYVQMGANSTEGRSFTWKGISAGQLGFSSSSLCTLQEAEKTLALCDDAQQSITKNLSLIGSYMSQLEHASSSVRVESDTTSDVQSRIRDADMAKEMIDYVKYNALGDAATVVLTQANQSTEPIMALIKG